MFKSSSISLRTFVAKVAILCVLAQAGIAAWHISTMFAAGALAGVDGHTAAACHALDDTQGTAGAGSSDEGTLLSHEDCTCCQVIMAGGALPMAANASPQPHAEAVSFAAITDAALFGAHLLAADSRAPPAQS